MKTLSGSYFLLLLLTVLFIYISLLHFSDPPFLILSPLLVHLSSYIYIMSLMIINAWVCFQAESSVEKYFSRSMLQDPWEALQPASDGRPERKQQDSLDYNRKPLNWSPFRSERDHSEACSSSPWIQPVSHCSVKVPHVSPVSFKLSWFMKKVGTSWFDILSDY